MSTAPVAINARAGVRRQIGGVERVTLELASRLPSLAPARYRVLTPRPGLAHRRGHGWEQMVLPVLARGSQLILSAANMAPLASSHNIVMIQDVAPFLGDWYGPLYARWHRALLPRVARGARILLAPSTVVRTQLERVLGADPNRTHLVPLGVGERFSRPSDVERVAARHGLERPYVLAVGSDVQRKNFGLLGRVAGTFG